MHIYHEAWHQAQKPVAVTRVSSTLTVGTTFLCTKKPRRPKSAGFLLWPPNEKVTETW